jgi:hypothetical protein
MVSVFVEKAIPIAIRFILCNILAAAEVVILGLGIFFIDTIVLSVQQHLLQSDLICRLIYTTLAMGFSSRLILMPTFAIVVVILVRHGITKIRLWPTIVSVMSLWLLSILPNLAIFSPKVWVFTTSDGCPLYATGTASIIYTFLFITVYGFCGMLITVVSTIYGVVYIKRHTISQDRSVMKNMLKFATFLLLGNTISFIGLSIALLIGTFSTIGKRPRETDEALNYVQGIALMCSLIPLPIMCLGFFKPIRVRFRSLLCFVCFKIKGKIISSTSKMNTAGEINNN